MEQFDGREEALSVEILPQSLRPAKPLKRFSVSAFD